MFLTYKRKRKQQSVKNSFDHGTWCHNSFSKEDPNNTPLATPDKHGKLIVTRVSEEQKEKPMHVSDGRRLCCGCVKEKDSSSLFPVQKPGRLEAGENENYDSTEMMVSAQKSSSMRLPCEDTLGSDATGLPQIEKCSEDGCGTWRNSFACESSHNGCVHCSDKRFISSSIELDTGNGSKIVSLEAADDKKLNSACDDKFPIFEKSMEEFPVSLSKDKFRSPSGHMVIKTKLTSPLITFSRIYKRKRISDGSDTRKEKLIDPMQSVELLGGKLLHKTQDNKSCRRCSMDNLAEINQSAELLERRHLCQTQGKVCLSSWLPGVSTKISCYSNYQHNVEHFGY